MNIKDKVRAAILSRTTEKVNQKIGIELETIIHTNDHSRLSVNEEGTFSSVDLMGLLNDEQDDNGSYSLEPGGQLEWASPCRNRPLNHPLKSYFQPQKVRFFLLFQALCFHHLGFA